MKSLFICILLIASTKAFANPFSRFTGTYAVTRAEKCIDQNLSVPCTSANITISVEDETTCIDFHGGTSPEIFCTTQASSPSESSTYTTYSNPGAAWDYHKGSAGLVRDYKHIGIIFLSSENEFMLNVSDWTLTGVASKSDVHSQRVLQISR